MSERPQGRWIGGRLIPLTPEEEAAILAEWEQARAEMSARAADAAYAARAAAGAHTLTTAVEVGMDAYRAEGRA